MSRKTSTFAHVQNGICHENDSLLPLRAHFHHQVVALRAVTSAPISIERVDHALRGRTIRCRVDQIVSRVELIATRAAVTSCSSTALPRRSSTALPGARPCACRRGLDGVRCIRASEREHARTQNETKCELMKPTKHNRVSFATF
jgi:hypothetical protein